MQLRNVLFLAMTVLCMTSCRTTKERLEITQNNATSSQMTKVLEESSVTEIVAPMCIDSSRMGFVPVVAVQELTDNTAAVVRNRDSIPVAILTRGPGNKLSFQPLQGFSTLSSYRKFVSNYDIVDNLNTSSSTVAAEEPEEKGLDKRLIVLIVASCVWILSFLACHLRGWARSLSNNC